MNYFLASPQALPCPILESGVVPLRLEFSWWVWKWLLYLIWRSDHSWGLETGSFGSSYLPILSCSYHLVWYFFVCSLVRPESPPHSSVWSFCFASLSNLILATSMINSVCSLKLIVAVETGAHLWTGPMWRSMMKRVLYYFQIHVKKSQEKEKQTCIRAK